MARISVWNFMLLLYTDYTIPTVYQESTITIFIEFSEPHKCNIATFLYEERQGKIEK